MIFRYCTSNVQFLARSFKNHASTRSIPNQTARIQLPEDFLRAIGRGMDGKLKTEDCNWNTFWHLDGNSLKKKDVGVTDRRYLLWSMEKFRQGFDPSLIAHPEKAKKTVRGRGPAVQNGRRIRSRRHS